jgi:hypothetical protein
VAGLGSQPALEPFLKQAAYAMLLVAVHIKDLVLVRRKQE